MKKINIFTIFMPSLIIFIILLMLFTNIFGLHDMDIKGLHILCLVLIFPIVFLVQGVISKLTNTNIILSLLVSIVAYIVFVFVFLNSSAIGYIIFYSIVYIIGCLVSKFILKFNDKKYG